MATYTLDNKNLRENRTKGERILRLDPDAGRRLVKDYECMKPLADALEENYLRLTSVVHMEKDDFFFHVFRIQDNRFSSLATSIAKSFTLDAKQRIANCSIQRTQVYERFGEYQFISDNIKFALLNGTFAGSKYDDPAPKVPMTSPTPPPPPPPPVAASSAIGGGGGDSRAHAALAADRAAFAAERAAWDAERAQAEEKRKREADMTEKARVTRIKAERDAAAQDAKHLPRPSFNSTGGIPLARAPTVVANADSSSGLSDITNLLARQSLGTAHIKTATKQIRVEVQTGNIDGARAIAKTVTQAKLSLAGDAQLTANQLNASEYLIEKLEPVGLMDVLQVYAKLYPGGASTTLREFVTVWMATLHNRRRMLGLESSVMEQLRAKYDNREKAKDGGLYEGTPVRIVEGDRTRVIYFVELSLDTFKQADAKKHPEKRLFCKYLQMELMRVSMEVGARLESGAGIARYGDTSAYSEARAQHGLNAADCATPNGVAPMDSKS